MLFRKERHKMKVCDKWYTCSIWLSWMVYSYSYGNGVWCHFQQYFSYNVYRGVSFIGRGNRSTRRKPPTCRKSLTNCIT